MLLLAATARAEPDVIEMRVGEQRVLLGALAEHVDTAQPERLRTVRLPGLGLHLRALAPGEATLTWGHPARLYARLHIAAAPALFAQRVDDRDLRHHPGRVIDVTSRAHDQLHGGLQIEARKP